MTQHLAPMGNNRIGMIRTINALSKAVVAKVRGESI